MRAHAVGVVVLAVGMAFGETLPTVRMGVDAAVRLDSDAARLSFVLLPHDGGRLETVNEKAERAGQDGSINYRFVQYGQVIGTGRASVRLSDKGVTLTHDYTAHKELKEVQKGFVLLLDAATFAELGWNAGEKSGKWPKKPGRAVLGDGTTTALTVGFPGGRTWTFAFEEGVKFKVLDGRCRGRGDLFEVFFCFEGKEALGIGQGKKAVCTVSVPKARPIVGTRDFVGVRQGTDWIRLPEAGTIRPGSVLDFSRLPPRRTPAGTDGNLQATTNGEFRFSRQSKEPFRFFGCIVGDDKSFAEKQVATDYTKHLTQLGYNAIRLIRVDRRLLTDGNKGLQCDEKAGAKLDQFVTGARRDGLYVAMDVLSSRGWKWSEFGLSLPNRPEPSAKLADALFLCDERVFATWKKRVGLVYGRRNKVGRRQYADDPAVPIVLPLAGGTCFSAWNDLRTLPFVRERYGKWLKGKRQADPDFMKDAVCEEMDISIMPLHEKKAGAIRSFLSDCETEGYGRMREHFDGQFRSKALIGSGDFSCRGYGCGVSSSLGEKYRMPCRLSANNPLFSYDAKTPPKPAKRPVCVTSWNAAGQRVWRSMSGLLVGGWAARQGWDGLFRCQDPSSDDPFALAAERAVFALFARGDLTPESPEDSFVIEDGALTVKTERTVGGFSPKADGRIEAGPLTVALKGSSAAVWISAVTSAPVTRAKRLLLTHLTELQKDGSLYSDSHRDLLMCPGKGDWIVRAGSARITLTIDRPTSAKVYAIGSDGARLGRIPAEVEGGALVFTVDVCGAKGAQYLYEITKE